MQPVRDWRWASAARWPGRRRASSWRGTTTFFFTRSSRGQRFPKPKTIQHAGRAEALAFHPTADRLAVAGGDADEVTLLDLAAPDKPVLVVRGSGRHLQGVNLSENGDVLGLRVGRKVDSLDPNDRAEGPWVRFNLARFTTTADANVKWVGVLREAGGWTIVPDEESRFVWYAQRKARRRHHPAASPRP